MIRSKTKLILIAISAALLQLIATPPFILAEDLDPTSALNPGISGVGNHFGNFTSSSTIIPTLVSIILFVASLTALFFIIYGSFNYVTAQDSSQKVEQSRRTIINAIVGLIIVALAFTIWQIVMNITGLNGSNLPNNATQRTRECTDSSGRWICPT